MGQCVLSFMCDAVGIEKACGRVDVEFSVCVQPVADPTHSDAADFGNAWFGGQRSFSGFYEFGVYSVHEAAEDVSYCGAQDRQNGHRDQQSDEGVGEGEPQGDTTGAEENGQRGESVSAGM